MTHMKVQTAQMRDLASGRTNLLIVLWESNAPIGGLCSEREVCDNQRCLFIIFFNVSFPFLKSHFIWCFSILFFGLGALISDDGTHE